MTADYLSPLQYFSCSPKIHLEITCDPLPQNLVSRILQGDFRWVSWLGSWLQLEVRSESTAQVRRSKVGTWERRLGFRQLKRFLA